MQPVDAPGWSHLHRAPASFPEELRAAARLVPDRIALDSEHEQLTFADLDRGVNRIAWGLLDRGVAGRPVGVLATHEPGSVVSMFGVLAAGGVCVPLDPREPPERLQSLADRVGIDLVVAASPDASGLGPGIEVVAPGSLVSHRDDDPRVPIRPDAPAMVYVTSGSTGSPKAIGHTHDSLVRQLWDQISIADFTSEDRVAIVFPLAFLGSAVVMGGALLVGARACLFDVGEHGADRTSRWLVDRQITHLSAVPTVVSSILAVMERHEVIAPTVQRLCTGGEAFVVDDLPAMRRRFPSARILNAYGCQEAATVALYQIPPHVSAADGPLPAGWVLPSCSVDVVDEAGQPVDLGESGEVVVRARHVARGYWDDAETTAELFVSLGDEPAVRTGDLGRFRPDGLLEVLGRLDGRVKVRGQGVDTVEVERALLDAEGVGDALVTALPDATGATRLFAHIVPTAGNVPTPRFLRQHLSKLVPPYAIPSAFAIVDALPRTPRGKVDRSALRSDAATRLVNGTDDASRAPTGSEADLAAIFAEVLGVARVGLDDDFFEMGGDSLGVVELVGLVADRFSVDIPASTVLAAPTVAELALRLSHRRPRDASPVVPVRTDRPGNPFFCVTGGGAPAISLRALGDALPDHNLFAIQARGLEERALPDHSVAAVARRNLLAMRAVQPVGPYALGGYSFGGLVAFEMACRLRAVGEDVALLVILDTDAPVARPTVTNRARVRLERLQRDAPDGRAQHAAVVTARATRFGVQSMYAHLERRISLASAGWLPRRGYHQYDLFLRLHTRMAYEYRPRHTFDGSTLVVSSDPAQRPRLVGARDRSTHHGVCYQRPLRPAAPARGRSGRRVHRRRTRSPALGGKCYHVAHGAHRRPRTQAAREPLSRASPRGRDARGDRSWAARRPPRPDHERHLGRPRGRGKGAAGDRRHRYRGRRTVGLWHRCLGCTRPSTCRRAVKVYLDSSAIVKLVQQESESAALRRFLRRHRDDRRVTSALARVEVVRAVDDGGPDAIALARSQLASVDQIALDAALLDDAATLRSDAPVRTLDAIHLASARALGADLRALVTYDQRMYAAGRDLGLVVEAPS